MRELLFRQHHTVRISDILLEFGKGFALTENARDFSQPSDIPVVIEPIFQSKTFRHALLPLCREVTDTLPRFVLTFNLEDLDRL